MSREKISAIIITRNNAQEIERCLRSIAWVDEIVVVDTFSTDGTVEICRRYGARVVQQDFKNFHTQLNSCLEHTTHDWTLNLFADETVSPELRAEIEAVFAQGPRCDGYEMPRRTFFHGRFLRWGGYYPCWHLRLWRKSKGSYRPREPHQKVGLEGKLGRLHGGLDHWCWQQCGEVFENFAAYPRIEARWRYFEEGRRVHSRQFLQPVWLFFKKFFLMQGFRYGMMGLILCLRPACERFLRLAMEWELQNEERLRAPGIPPDFADAARPEPSQHGEQ